MVFVEFPAFSRARDSYLSEEEFRLLQQLLILNPAAGVLIQGTGGLRKIRFRDRKRRRGVRGGYRVIYYWHSAAQECLLCALYAKSEVEDLTTDESAMIAALITEYRNRML